MTERPVLGDIRLLVLLVVGATRPDLGAGHKRTGGYTRRDVELSLDLLGCDPTFVLCRHVASGLSDPVAYQGSLAGRLRRQCRRLS